MRVLVLAPHADDETLGCGGTMARLASEGHEITVGLVTGHGANAHPLYDRPVFETVQAELDQAMRMLGVARVLKADLPTVLLPDLPRHEVNAAVAQLIEQVQPELMFVPFPFDLHRDHREIHHAASVAWRPYLQSGRAIREVLCYEVPTETHLNIPYVEPGFIPNVWFDISDYVDRKIEAFGCFASQAQADPLPRSPSALRALATWRGSQMGVAAAEAFVLVRGLR